jgi:5'-deoxynucleotidase YfbR-like HD superfamily hydrolase
MDKRERVYISGGVTGLPDYTERFEKVEERLTAQGYAVINPSKINAKLPTDTDYEAYMHVSFALIDTADAIYMMKNWQNSRGATREKAYAASKEMIIMYEETERSKYRILVN